MGGAKNRGGAQPPCPPPYFNHSRWSILLERAFPCCQHLADSDYEEEEEEFFLNGVTYMVSIGLYNSESVRKISTAISETYKFSWGPIFLSHTLS